MNSYKKLISNSLIFAIGNLGSKLIVIIMVPVYTYYLSQSEYGLTDLVTTTVNLMIPIITLSVYEAVLRYTMDKSSTKSQILSNGFFITLCGNLILWLLYDFIIKLVPFGKYTIHFLIILTMQSFQNLFSQYLRATGKTKEFAINGIITAITLATTNVLLIIFFSKGVDGYLTSIIFSTSVSLIYLLIKTQALKKIKLKLASIVIIKQLLHYSIPLMPNAVMWWIMNASNRFFILFYSGIEANGLFAVASKIPSVLSIFQSIFFQAWQLSAIEEFENDKKSEFYSNVFLYFSTFMLFLISIILVFLKPTIYFVLANQYYDSWRLVPFLLMGVLFSSFSSFLGTNYVAAKQTKGVFFSSMIGALINVAICIILIPRFGVLGASIATMASFFFIWIYRYIDTKKFIDMTINNKHLIINIILIYIQIGTLYLNQIMGNIFNLLLCITFILINLSTFKTVLIKFTRRR